MTEFTERNVAGGRDRSDAGATLLLALLFLVAVSLISVSLVQWTGNDLANTSKFVSAQSIQSAADSANQTAIQFVQYNFLSASLDGASATPSPCWTLGSTPSETSANNQTVDSWCMTRWYPGSSTSTRDVTISTCLSGVSALQCVQQPLLQSIVTIIDGASACSPVINVTPNNTCGQSVNVAQWQFGALPPQVSAVTSDTFSCTSGVPVTVTGTNLDQATDADFLFMSGGAPQTVQGTVVGSSPTSVQVCVSIPSPSPASSFYVVVSTPMGSNLWNSASWSPG